MRVRKNISGFSLVEAVIALAIFGLFVGSVTAASRQFYSKIDSDPTQLQAQTIAQDAIEIIRSIRHRAWNEFTYAKTGLSFQQGEWVFDGEGTENQIDGFTRYISFSAVCRNDQDEIADCPAAYTDIHQRQVSVHVEWKQEDISQNIVLSSILSNWDSREFLQAQWSGGAGQTIMQNSMAYDSDDGNISFTQDGELQLLKETGVCNPGIWSFDIADAYTFDEQDIEIGEEGFAHPRVQESEPVFEVGRVTTDHHWQEVQLKEQYDNPVIVATHQQKNNGLPVSVRIRNVQADRFEIRLQHASTQELDLAFDQIDYLVVEEGQWEVEGVLIDAKNVQEEYIGFASNNWNGTQYQYGANFLTNPIVLHQVIGYEDPSWVHTFVRSINSKSNPPTKDGFRLGLSLTEVAKVHDPELVSVVAIEANQAAQYNGVLFESQRTADTVTGHGTNNTFAFLQGYDFAPIVIGSQQEVDGGNGGWLVLNDITSSSVNMYIDEDQQKDAERNHTSETVGFFAAATSTSFGIQRLADGVLPIKTGSHVVSNIDQWTSFDHEAEFDGGSVTYQLSSDNGATWRYYAAGAWQIANNDAQANTADVVDQFIHLFSTTTKQIAVRAMLQTDGEQDVRLDEIRIGCANKQFEVGRVFVDDEWQTIELEQAYSNPVIITSVEKSQNNTPVSVRLRNVSSTQFDVRLEHPSGQPLVEDPVAYVVIEEGLWTIGDLPLEARTIQTNKVGRKQNNWRDFETQTFRQSFNQSPIVFHQVQTANDPNWISSYVARQDSRTAPPSVNGMRIALNGAEAVQAHEEEIVGWIAIARNTTSTIGNIFIDVQQTRDIVRGIDNGCYTLAYQEPFNEQPISFVSQQEMDGGDGSWGVICENSLEEIRMAAQEDQEGDNEQSHTTETYGLLAFSQPFHFSTVDANERFAQEGSLVSSAFYMGTNSSAQAIEWDELIEEQCNDCSVEFQISTAGDNNGVPGVWTNWYGMNGVDSRFTTAKGSLLSTDLNKRAWIRYRVFLRGDEEHTPILRSVRLNYK